MSINDCPAISPPRIVSRSTTCTSWFGTSWCHNKQPPLSKHVTGLQNVPQSTHLCCIKDVAGSETGRNISLSVCTVSASVVIAQWNDKVLRHASSWPTNIEENQIWCKRSHITTQYSSSLSLSLSSSADSWRIKWGESWQSNFFFYFNACTLYLLLFCTMTNKWTQLFHKLSHCYMFRHYRCHPQTACNQYLAKLHKYFKCSCW